MAIYQDLGYLQTMTKRSQITNPTNKFSFQILANVEVQTVIPRLPVNGSSGAVQNSSVGIEKRRLYCSAPIDIFLNSGIRKNLSTI